MSDLIYDCEHCADRNQVVDSRNGGVYSFACSTLAKGSLLVGERAPNDNYCDDEHNIPKEEHRATYGLLPHQVTQNLYRQLDGELRVNFYSQKIENILPFSFQMKLGALAEFNWPDKD